MPGPEIKQGYIQFLYIHRNGDVESSRDFHWRDIETETLVRIECYWRRGSFVLDVDDLPLDFLEFVSYRSSGTTKITLADGSSAIVPLDSISFGYTNGSQEFLTEFHYFDGTILKNDLVHVHVSDPLINLTHFHPRSIRPIPDSVKGRGPFQAWVPGQGKPPFPVTRPAAGPRHASSVAGGPEGRPDIQAKPQRRRA